MDVALQQQVNEGTALPLMEAFYTLQGEGYYKGSAAYFIRIGGCDVGCHWCDVKESWDAAKHPPTQIQEIVEEAYQYSKTIVITGGEPLMWNMEPLTQALNLKNMQIHIETSGAYPITGKWDWFFLQKRICFLQLRLTILPMNLKSLFIIKMIYFLQKNKPNM
jgi:organic radical activating enzyme